MPDGMEFPATGKTVEILGVSVIKVRDGEIVTMHDYFDSASWMTQLGMLPVTP